MSLTQLNRNAVRLKSYGNYGMICGNELGL